MDQGTQYNPDILIPTENQVGDTLKPVFFLPS